MLHSVFYYIGLILSVGLASGVAIYSLAKCWVWCIDAALRALRVSEVVVDYMWERKKFKSWSDLKSEEDRRHNAKIMECLNYETALRYACERLQLEKRPFHKKDSSEWEELFLAAAETSQRPEDIERQESDDESKEGEQCPNA